MNPRTLLRTAALGALSAAAGSTDPDFAPLIGAPAILGATWPSQSPAAGSAPMPNQLLLYGWEERSETVAEKTTAPLFETELTLVVEARVEAATLAAAATLPAQPTQAQIDAAVDGALDALCFAVKKALCQGLGVAAMALEGKPVITGIKSVETASRYDANGQRVIGQGHVALVTTYGERFEPLIPNALEEIVALVGPTAGGLANSGNHGNGAISAVTVGLGAEPGAYAVLFISPTSFTVTKPDSTSAGTGTVGSPFTGGGLGFTISAGTASFIAGDGFTVTVQVAAENLISF